MSVSTEKYSGDFMETIIQQGIDAVENSRMDQLCQCGARRGEHSHDGANCPNPYHAGPLYLERKFRLLQCEATVNDQQCQSLAVRGRMCAEHYTE